MNLNAFLKSLTKKENYLKAKEEGLKPVWFEDEYFQKFVEFLDYIFTSSDGVTDVKAAILQLADIRIADNEERAQFLIKVDDIFRSEEITGFEVALKLLKEKFISRIFVRSLKRIVTHLEEGNIQKAGNTVQKISRLFSELSLPFQSVRSVTDITVHKEALSPVKKGILTGYASIDKATSGMKPGELVVVMSGFAEGKSTLLLNIAYNVFKQGFNVVYFSLEMPYVQVVRRLDSLVSGIPYRKIKEGTLSVDEKVSLKN
ncbi:MAG: DnaB-like helicase C-terminal domain-containing protein, partial [Candidatus Micrarchaeia archaeon]